MKFWGLKYGNTAAQERLCRRIWAWGIGFDLEFISTQCPCVFVFVFFMHFLTCVFLHLWICVFVFCRHIWAWKIGFDPEFIGAPICFHYICRAQIWRLRVLRRGGDEGRGCFRSHQYVPLSPNRDYKLTFILGFTNKYGWKFTKCVK